MSPRPAAGRTDQLEVRAATADDAVGVAHVHVEAWRGGYAGLMPADYLAALDWRTRVSVTRGWLDNPPRRVATLVAVRGHVVGFTTFGPVRDDDLPPDRTGEIYALNVHPSAWSTGAGSALLLAAVAALSGSDVVVLWVLAENSRARRFYERHGFQPDGTAKNIAVGGVELPELRYRRL